MYGGPGENVDETALTVAEGAGQNSDKMQISYVR